MPDGSIYNTNWTAHCNTCSHTTHGACGEQSFEATNGISPPGCPTIVHILGSLMVPDIHIASYMVTTKSSQTCTTKPLPFKNQELNFNHKGHNLDHFRASETLQRWQRARCTQQRQPKHEYQSGGSSLCCRARSTVCISRSCCIGRESRSMQRCEGRAAAFG